MYDIAYHFPVELMDDENYILERIQQANLPTSSSRKAYDRILRFLYISEYDQKVNRRTLRKYDYLLSQSEKILAYRLETRCSGSERYQYGINSVLAVKRSMYQCEVCKCADVRCLDIDHKFGRRKPKANSKYVYYEVDDFQFLCANHHRIKTVVSAESNNKLVSTINKRRIFEEF